MTPEEQALKRIEDIGGELRKEMKAIADAGNQATSEQQARVADLDVKQNAAITDLQKQMSGFIAEQNRIQEAKQIKTFADVLKANITPEMIHGLRTGSLRETKAMDFPMQLKVNDPQVVGSSTSGVYYADRRAEIKGYPLYIRRIRDLFMNASTSLNSIDLPSEKASTDGMAVQTEGNALGTSDLLIDKTNLKVLTIGANVTLSMDALDDLPGMSTWISRRLTDRYIAKENLQLITGTTYGVYTTAPVADPTDWNISNANYWNILVAAIGAVLASKNVYPTAVLLNPTDLFNKLIAATSSYNFFNPQAVSNGLPLTIAGVPVLASEAITAGTFLLGDFSLAGVWERQAPQVTFGLNSDDFEKNNMSVKITSRLASGTDLPSAFLKGTLATVLACGSA